MTSGQPSRSARLRSCSKKLYIYRELGSPVRLSVRADSWDRSNASALYTAVAAWPQIVSSSLTSSAEWPRSSSEYKASAPTNESSLNSGKTASDLYIDTEAPRIDARSSLALLVMRTCRCSATQPA